MPGPKGVITINGNFQRSDACDRDFSKISETFGMEQTLEEPSLTNDTTYMPEQKKQAVDKAFSTADGITKHQVHPTDPAKTVRVSTSLSPA